MHDNSGGGLVTNDLKNLFLATYATSLTMFSVILIKFAASAISQKWPAVARKSASLDFSLELMTLIFGNKSVFSLFLVQKCPKSFPISKF